MRSEDVDVLIVGGGHNGLVCVFYLAKAGRRVTVLERREIVGGAAVTEEFRAAGAHNAAREILRDWRGLSRPA